jgi:hypothetical protein
MIRRLVLAATLVAASVTPILFTSAANAIPVCKAGYTCLYEYYSNEARTDWIGYVDIPCSGPAVIVGEQSGYFTFGEAQCGGDS